jgi:sugar lactone lactonase YvrE
MGDWKDILADRKFIPVARGWILYSLLILGFVVYGLGEFLSKDKEPNFLFHGLGAAQTSKTDIPSNTYLSTLKDFAFPVAVTQDLEGNLWVIDHSNNRILRVEKDNRVYLVAGNGSSKASGDGGPAQTAGIFPIAFSLGPDGSLYVADHENHRIRKIFSDGTIETLAGTGQAGFSGDGGLAWKAQLNDPTGVAVDQANNIYVADHGNHRIRVVRPDGTIETLAGNGQEGFSGDGGPALEAQLSSPWSVTVDCKGGLLVTDIGNNRIRVIHLDGKIQTVAGDGKSEFKGDGGPAVAASINSSVAVAPDCRTHSLYIADTGSDRIRRVNQEGIIQTVAGTGIFGSKGDGGTALNAEFGSPYGLWVDPQGGVYVADANNQRIRYITPNQSIRTVLSPLRAEYKPKSGVEAPVK